MPDSSSYRSKERLLSVYPHLCKEDLGRLTPAKLLQDSAVRTRLGTSFTLPPTDSDNLMANLEEYLSSSVTSGRALWPLVKRVEVSGRFPLLASGVILVDLPGHGDDDDTRNNLAAQYIKEAAGVILVVDSKRAQNDRDTLGYLRKTLNGLVLDGRSVEEGVMLAVTGTDMPIGDNEVKLDEADRKQLNQIVKKLKEIRQSVPVPKKTKSPGKTKRQDSLKQAELDLKMREAEKEKLLLLANVRIASVRQAIQKSFEEVYARLAPDRDKAPELPIFCVGSRDYVALNSGMSTPSVFGEEEQTGIPQLKSHLRVTGDRRRIRWATHLLDKAYVLSELIHSYFSEGRHPGQLRSENKANALMLIEDLKEANRKEVESAWEAIEDELHRVEADLKEAVTRATRCGPFVMKELGSNMCFSTYKALMRHNGLYLNNDINRQLTREILPAIQGSWNGGINNKIPLTLKDATENLEKNTITAIAQICKALDGAGMVFEKTMTTAAQSLAVEGLLSDMCAQAIDTISLAQRDGTRAFDTIIREELTAQYQLASQEAGKGALARMKNSNVAYLEQNGVVVFNSINIRIKKLLQDAFSKIRHDMRNELQDITTMLRLSLIEEINLPKDHKELKAQILQLTLENRPCFVAKRIDLADRRRALGMN
ncbi:hypothetical protein B0H11DRAFT_175447 [Mycena galericulata]|nr:hypothetical protein B0H11DRAFT_175447 [Mycena galericulata]